MLACCIWFMNFSSVVHDCLWILSCSPIVMVLRGLIVHPSVLVFGLSLLEFSLMAVLGILV